MDRSTMIESLRNGASVDFPAEAASPEYAAKLDKQDPLRHLREQFIIPTKASLKRKALQGQNSPFLTTPLGASTNGYSNGTNGTTNGSSESDSKDSETPSIYFCGNSLGVQPKAVRSYLAAHLETWASIGVNGHFSVPDASPLVPWQDMAEFCAKQSAPIVGAKEEEVVIMNTLTANVHFMMASFYKPTQQRHKIICEWKPFPSDYYAIESQIQWHGLSPATSMIQLQPDSNNYLSTSYILSVIDEHASSTALLLLPGIQYYSGQLFDIPRITAYAQERGIVVGWDLAHAAGNVEVQLHDWNVDFAMWCTYKYMNAGPGAIAGAFVHERHGGLEVVKQEDGSETLKFRHRLTGWYGGDKSVRFNMDNKFRPTPGAAGFQMSNPSVIDLTSLAAALSVFNQTDIKALREKSLLLTAYAEWRLNKILKDEGEVDVPAFHIITPKDPRERGAQLSVLLKPGILERISRALEENGIICDKRKPDVIRVAPVPMYNTFQDVATFMDVFEGALNEKA